MELKMWHFRFGVEQIQYFIDLIETHTVTDDSIEVQINPFVWNFLEVFRDPDMKFDQEMKRIENDHVGFLHYILNELKNLWVWECMYIPLGEEEVDFWMTEDFEFWSGYHEYLSSIFSAKWKFIGIKKFLRLCQIYFDIKRQDFYVKTTFIQSIVHMAEQEKLDIDMVLDYARIEQGLVFHDFATLLLSTAIIQKDKNWDYNLSGSDFAEVVACIFTLIGTDKLKKYEWGLKWMINLEKNIKCNFGEKEDRFSQISLALDFEHPTHQWFSQFIVKKGDFWILYYKSVKSKKTEPILSVVPLGTIPAGSASYSYDEKTWIFQVNTHRVNIKWTKNPKQLAQVMVATPFSWISFEYIHKNTTLKTPRSIRDAMDHFINVFRWVENMTDADIPEKMTKKQAKLVFYYSYAKDGHIMFCPKIPL